MPALAPIVIDFETYYGEGYTLRSLTTEEYIRDRQFQVIGFSVVEGGGTPVWYSGDDAYMTQVLHALRLNERMVIAHNAQFDMGILSWRYGIHPKFIVDTMAMARGLVGLDTGCGLEKLAEYFQLSTRKGREVHNAKNKRREDFSIVELQMYGNYACTDALLEWELFEKLLPHMLDSEMQLIDWTVRAFTDPDLELDGELIDLEYRAFLARRSGLLQTAGIGDITELRSDNRMADLLIALGVEPPTKVSPTTGEITWAFSKSDVEFMELRDHEDERVVAVVEARLGSKTSQVQSRLERFRGIAQRGLLPVPLEYAGATPTRRWSGRDKINLQNLPRSKVRRDAHRQIVYNEKGKPIIDPSPLRKAIRVRAGRKMAVGDLSQIELRVNAWQCGQNDVLELLRGGGDTYADMASAIYGFEVNKKQHVNERFVGKTAVLGCGYGCGGPKFQHMLKVAARRDEIQLPDESLDFAQGVVKIYRDKNAQIKRNWYRWNDALETIALGGTAEIGPYKISQSKIWLPNGSYLYYPELALREKKGRDEIGVEWSYMRMRNGRKCQTKLYGAKLVENITQAVARLFVSDALLRLQTVKYQNGERVFRIVNMVHDELVMTYADGLDDAWVKDVMSWAFTTRPEWAPEIPLAYEGEVGYNYAECK